MAAQESLPSARAEHLHVRSDSPGGGICCLHRVSAAVLQAGTAAACAASEAVVMRFNLVKFNCSSTATRELLKVMAAATRACQRYVEEREYESK